MDQMQETVSTCCDTSVPPKPPMSLEQAQIELVMSERDLVLAERVYKAADQAFAYASRAEAISKLNRESAVARRDYYREMVTKAARAVMIGLCLLLPRFAQAQTITIPVTVPPPTPLTVVVPQGTKVVSNGVTYVVTGTLTLTPVVTIGELPPNWPLPTIEQFLLGDKAIETASLGDELILKGNSFGDEMGVLVIGNDVVPVASWADAEIHVVLDPALVTPAPNGSFVTLRRGTDHERGWRDGPVILPKAG